LDSHDYHADRLLMAYRDCGRYVYLLRRSGARDLANQLVDLNVRAMSLSARYRHLSITNYRRRTDDLINAYTDVMAKVVRRYPGLADEVDRIEGRLSPLRTRRIAVTLRDEQWSDIENRIRSKEHRSVGDYFAYLYRLHRR